MLSELFFEDFSVGQIITTQERVTITREDARAFARLYDPQLQHLDEQQAAGGRFGDIIVSGWQTAAITMRLKIHTPLAQVSGGLLGMGLEHLRWPRPVYPGDTLRLSITITGMRVSASKPGYGILQYKAETFNQRDEIVLSMQTAVLVPRRE